MKFKKLFLLAIGAAFLLTSAGKPIATANEIGEIKENVTQQVMRLANLASDEEETEDPEEILSRAIEDYKEEFDDYINITALNVLDKEDVNLPNFDINYIAPTYAEVMNEYQINLEASLTPIQLEKYDLLRQRDYNFDKYVALNQNKYLDLTIPPKYDHVTTMAVVTTALVGILSGAGLTQAAISAFTGAVGTLSAAISTSWIPIVGWVLAVGLAVGALIALTVIIVQYWDEICSVINEIKNWFLEQFNAFADLINSYFNDAIAQGEESKVAYRKKIGGREREFIDTEVTAAVLSKIVDDCLKNDTVYLLGHIGDPEKGEHWWICYDTTDAKTVIDEKLYNLGVCTYTWYNNTAKKMMAEGSILNGDYSLLIYERPDEGTATVHGENDLIGWNHYHLGRKVLKNGEYVLDKYETKPYKWAHSMFGKLAYREVGGDEYTYYPDGFLG